LRPPLREDTFRPRGFRQAFDGEMGERTDIAIIGPGKVGTALGVLARRAGWSVRGVAGGRVGRARAATETIGDARTGSPADVASTAGLVLLTVPDDAVRDVCEELSAAGAVGEGTVVAHCSGALDSEVLSTARDLGAAVGSMHPLQTFPTVEAAIERMLGTFFFIEGDEGAVEALEAFASAVGGRPVRIDARAKPLYHAAAVLACNYLTALLDAALAAAQQAGIERGVAAEAMEPLVRATLDNVFALGPERALTGPIVRGDGETVRRHLRALAGGELDGLYRAVGAYTAGVAERSGRLSPAAAAEMRRLLRHREKE
jgi:predicted short-subunit dehydrogenase-like oxidoreductase (DUF2520 family)